MGKPEAYYVIVYEFRQATANLHNLIAMMEQKKATIRLDMLQQRDDEIALLVLKDRLATIDAMLNASIAEVAAWGKLLSLYDEKEP